MIERTFSNFGIIQSGFTLPEEGQTILESFIANFDTLFRVQLKEDLCTKSRDLIRMEVSKTVKFNPVKHEVAANTRSPLELTKSPLLLNPPMEIRYVRFINLL